jgi:hypothetical protein
MRIKQWLTTTAIAASVAACDGSLTGPNFHELGAEDLVVCTNKELPGDYGEYNCSLKTMADFGLPPLSSFVVRRPGVGFFDRTARRKELAEASLAAVRDACRYNGGQPDWRTTAEPLPRTYNRDTPGLQQKVIDIDNKLLDAAGRWLGLRESDAAEWARQTLLMLARNESLLGFERRNSSPYDAKRLAMVGFNAFYAIEDFPALTPSERDVILAYFDKLVAAQDFLEATAWENPVNELQASDIHNHAWFKDANVMQLGAYRGDDRAFQAGVRRYVSVLAGLVRADGSVAAEASRGGVAIHYTANAVTHMAQFAEAAALQGYDLYAIRIGHADIHKMVEFYLDARDNHAVIEKYAKAQWNCLSPEQCARWNNQDLSSVNQDSWNIAAWAEVYIRRFPGTPLSNRLRALYPTATFKNMTNDIWGGATTCQFRKI